MPAAETTVQLVAVQMQVNVDDYWTHEAFAERVDGLMGEVARRANLLKPTLVVFPEDVGLLLVVQGLRRSLGRGVSGVEGAITRGVRADFLRTAWYRRRTGLSWVPALFYARRRVIARTYFEVFAEAARRYGVYLVAGSVILPHYEVRDGVVDWHGAPLERGVFNTSYVFSPDGDVLGRQSKVHLIELEQDVALDLSPAPIDQLQVVDTDVGRLGIAICLDSFQDDVASRLAQLGAEILVQPSANPCPWDVDQQVDWMRGSYSRTFREGGFVYAVNPMMTGSIWDLDFFGQSSISANGSVWRDLESEGRAERCGYAKLSREPGFVRVAESDHAEEIVCAEVPHPSRYALDCALSR